MSEQYVATAPIFAGRARVANPGDPIPATHPKLEEWLKAGLVERAPEPKAVEDMTVDELKVLAEERGIDLDGATLKADILAKVQGS